MSIHFHTLTIKDIRRETPECISVAFDIPEHLNSFFQFTHGQNITLKAIIGAEEIRRSYSICSSPLDKELRVAIKHMEGGRFSAWANKELIKGNTLEVLPPTGKFYTELNAINKKQISRIRSRKRYHSHTFYYCHNACNRTRKSFYFGIW